MFIHHSLDGSLIFAVYIDDNLLTNNDPAGIKKAKAYLKAQFVTKEMGRPRYFIGIEILTAHREWLFLNGSTH